MRWIDVLTVWGYPKASELAPALEELGLDPNKYHYPWELGRDLKSIVKTRGIPDWILEKLGEFFKWLGSIIYEYLIKPYAIPLGLIVVGGIVTWVASGWYRALGAIPIGVGVYMLVKPALEGG